MIALPRHGLVLVTPPKTASTALHQTLCTPEFGGVFVIGPQGDDASPYEHHTGWVPWSYVDFRIVIVVRHPYTRFLSLYDHARACVHEGSTWPGSLADFAAWFTTPDAPWFYRWSLSRFADDIHSGRDGRRLATAGWIKVEHLEGGLKLYGVEARVPRVNASTFADRPELTASIRAMIESLWAEDFERFRYKITEHEGT